MFAFSLNIFFILQLFVGYTEYLWSDHLCEPNSGNGIPKFNRKSFTYCRLANNHDGLNFTMFAI